MWYPYVQAERAQSPVLPNANDLSNPSPSSAPHPKPTPKPYHITITTMDIDPPVIERMVEVLCRAPPLFLICFALFLALLLDLDVEDFEFLWLPIWREIRRWLDI